MSEPREHPADASPLAAGSLRTTRRRRYEDLVARRIVQAGGFTVIVSLGGILVFLALEALPLLASVRVSPAGSLPAPTAGRAILVDPYRAVVVGLSPDGTVRAEDLASGEARGEWQPFADLGPFDEVRSFARAGLLAGRTADGRIATLPVTFHVSFPGGERRVDIRLEPVRLWSPQSSARLSAFATDGDTLVAALESGGLAVLERIREENPFTGEATEELRRQRAPGPPGVRDLRLGFEARHVYGVGSEGELLEWVLGSGSPGPPQTFAAESPIRALTLLEGARTLATGHSDGAVGIWFHVPRAGRRELVRARRFEIEGPAITDLAAAGRNLVALREDGSVELLHATTGPLRTLRGPTRPAPRALHLTPRGDRLLLLAEGELRSFDLEIPHPGVDLTTLFGEVWYEGYPAPARVWQSSGGSDSFEPKLSLAPLMVGTLKGTAYALLFALPLGLLAALYASQFLHPVVLRWVKPTIELMASLPSVVLGFLAGLWLAPRLEAVLPGALLMLAAVPAASLTAGALWSRVPARLERRLPAVSELAWQTVAIGGTLVVCLMLSDRVEAALFAGDFSRWLRETTGLVYEQRNALVAGLAMGFAVIPILFAISEDALSHVPRDLISGSLALGATRWQTVRRVVLPVASPGLLAAVVIGLGRAIGETMIVLMATGNTPLLDFNAFSGFRTLSANIAVEIPEAPQGGTLYRTLFASAFLLFVVTFALNAVAEWARERTRRRFGAA